MPALSAAGSIDALVSVDPWMLDAVELKQHLGQLAAARSTVAAAEAVAIAEFDHRGCCVDDGMVNARSWLAHHTGVPRVVAGGRVLLAKGLRRMPRMAGALASGSVTEAHARAMARCLTPRTVAALERDESLLVTKAKELDADDFELLVTRWLLLNDENGPTLARKGRASCTSLRCSRAARASTASSTSKMRPSSASAGQRRGLIARDRG